MAFYMHLNESLSYMTVTKSIFCLFLLCHFHVFAQNPSIDLQAMARVWREGQRLPVTIFRFVTLGKIEQSIMEVSEVSSLMKI